MSQVVREMYASEVTATSVTLSPLADLESRPAASPLNQITISTYTQYAPCEVFTSVASCARYEVTIRRKT